MVNMKRCLTLIVVFLILLSNTISVSAAQSESIIHSQSYALENGIVVTDELISSSPLRSSTRDYTLRRTFSTGGTTIAIIALYGEFTYDGSHVSVLEKSVTQTSTYNGWNYAQTSLTSSGGTITLNAKLTKLLHSSIPINMTLSCDANGNISYT